ncbi:suppressor of fused domain protein [Streptomyces tricolor]|nr:suppressor of fused domain protein [Streptomyces tricolor]
MTTALGEPDARAAVTFPRHGTVSEVLRFQEGDVVRYATLGMSPAPHDGSHGDARRPGQGPRAELVLSVRAGVADTDKVLRPLAVLAASPQVEGLVVTPGAFAGRGRSAVARRPPSPRCWWASLGGLVEDLELDAPMDPVRFLPLLPMTPNEAAWKRVHRRPGAPGALARERDGPEGPRPADPSRWTDAPPSAE